MLPPCFTLRLRNTRFDTLDLRGTKAGGSALVLGATEAGADGTLEVIDRGANGRASLAVSERAGHVDMKLLVGGEGGSWVCKEAIRWSIESWAGEKR